jgi:stage V sporulation protein SpoVS
MSLIKVSAKAPVSAVAGVIMRVIRDHQRAELLAVGEEAVNRALKAVDLATIHFRQNGTNVLCVMESANETIIEDDPPAIKLIVEPQSSLDLPVVDGS